MLIRDRHANEHTALKRLGGDFTDRKKRVVLCCSLDRISKVYRYRHQLKIKFHLYLIIPVIKKSKRMSHGG